MTLGIVVSLFGLGTALVLLFTLAIYAVPFFVGLTVGMWAFETGTGVIGAVLVGIVAGAVALFAAQLLFASVRSLALRAVIALLFAAPERITASATHIGYLQRDGVTRDGAKARLFDAGSDNADGGNFVERCTDDRHHFRFIVSAEDRRLVDLTRKIHEG